MTTSMSYDQVHAWDNLYLAWRNAARGKRSRPAAASFEYRLEDNLVTLQQELAAKSYRPGPYASFHIHEPKKRLISAAPFRDRVVHHALCNVIEPAFERSFIDDSYANRAGKGTHRALDRCQAFARCYHYVLSCDVVQFFPAIDHELLEATLRCKVRDPDLVWLIRQILAGGIGVLGDSYEMVYFPGDDLFAAGRPRGLPIGNLTSQFWANCFLNPFDHFVKRELGCQAYLRYVDDLALFSNDRRQLWAWKAAVTQRLAQMRLTIHEERAQVKPVAEGIPFLGFVVFPQSRRLKARKGYTFPLFTKTFDFVTWLMSVTNHFPRSQRFLVTKRLLDAALNFHELLMEANNARMPQRLEKLKLADAELDKVRIYLRLTLKWEWLKPGQYQHAAAMVTEIGRLLGGWQKVLRQA